MSLMAPFNNLTAYQSKGIAGHYAIRITGPGPAFPPPSPYPLPPPPLPPLLPPPPPTPPPRLLDP